MKTALLLRLGALSAPLFIVMFFLAGSMHPDYNWLRYPISSLSIGPLGWMQILNFVIAGSLMILLALGLRRSFDARSRGALWGPLLVALAGLGLVGAGIFVSDPLFGYPPSLPLVLKQFTWHGHLHDLFSMFMFAGLPAACFVFWRRFAALGERGWATYSLMTAFGMLVFFVLAGLAFNQVYGLVNIGGVFQRLTIGAALVWLSLLALSTHGSKAERSNASG